MKNKILIIITILGTILFNYIFWKESVGNNAIIFSLFSIGIMIYAFPESIKSKGVAAVAVSVILSAVAIAIHASVFSIIIWIISLFMLPSFIHNMQIKTVFFNFVNSYSDYFSSFNIPFENIKINKNISEKFSASLRFIKLTVIPLAVLFVFYWIFKFANPIFDKISSDFFITIGDWLRKIFKNISITQILFTIWGFSLIVYFAYKKNNHKTPDFEAEYSEKITRNKTKNNGKKTKIFSIVKTLKPELKNEYRTGMILIVLINVLLLIINIIDINWVWFGFEYKADFDLKQFVHEGTYLLILSILISIAIMVYFFRANLNFYPKIKFLQIVAYIWIAQNIILTVSVALRNIIYIEYFGLAYKRIGVFFFLALVIFGLITLIFKIIKRKTTFRMIKENSWAVYIGFILFAFPDWDNIIAKKNLNHHIKENIETSYLLTLDDKILPLIDQHPEILKQPKELNTYKYFYDAYQDIYNRRVDKFMKRYKNKKFFSRNYADDKAFKYFKTKYPDKY